MRKRYQHIDEEDEITLFQESRKEAVEIWDRLEKEGFLKPMYDYHSYEFRCPVVQMCVKLRLRKQKRMNACMKCIFPVCVLD